MQASRSRDIQQAFVLTDADLRQLVDRVSSRVGIPRISVSCVDGVSRSFVDLAELDQFGNPDAKRIVSLALQARERTTDASASISFSSRDDGLIRYNVDGPEDFVLAVSDMLQAQIDAVRPWYSTVARLDFIGVMFTVVLGIAVLIFVGAAMDLFPLAPSSSVGSFFNRSNITGLLIGIAPFPLGLLCNRFRSRVFPFGEFALGYGASRFRRLETIRTTVVVAFAISVAAGVVAARILNS